MAYVRFWDREILRFFVGGSIYFTMAEHHNNLHDVRAELEMWADMWDEVQEKGIHPDIEPVKSTSPDEPFALDSKAQDYYYDYLGSNYDIEDDEPQVLQEDKSPNPVYPDSVGPDHTTTSPVWASDELLKEVEKLKDQLFDVENRMAKMGGDEKWSEKVHHPDDKKVMGEVESLRKRLEKVSSQLGIEHEPSPWEIKRD